MKKLSILLIFAFLFLVSSISVQGALTDNIITYWSLNETGGVAVDSLNNYSATYSGTASVVNGKISNGRQIPVTVGTCWSTNGALIGGLNTMTINYWINSTSITNGQGIMDYLRDTNGLYVDFKTDGTNALRAGGIQTSWPGMYKSDGQYHMYTWVFNQTSDWFYVDGVLNFTSLNHAPRTMTSNAGTFYWNGYDCGAGSHSVTGYDEIGFWSTQKSQAEITQLYNNGNGLAYPFIINNTNYISFVSQVPSDLTSTALFSSPTLNITYNYNFTNNTFNNPRLNYSVTSPVLSCIESVNGSCMFANNTFRVVTPSSNVSNANYSNQSFILRENDVYSYVANLNLSLFFNNVHLNYTMNNSNMLISTTFKNLSNLTQFNILEVMATSTGSSIVYACNSTYDFNSVVSSNSNCQEIGRLTSNYNHTHNANSSHQLIPFSIVNGLLSAGVKVTSNTTFIVAGVNSQITNVSYINNFTDVGITRTAVGGGTTWTNQIYTVDSHLHQWSNQEYLNYIAIGEFNGTTNTSSNRSELIDVPPLQPQPPIITVPFNTNQSTQFMNISYLNATSTSQSVSITYYNISLLNNDTTFNRTIIANNSLNNSYNWNVYAENLTLGEYFVRVTAYTNFASLTSFDQENYSLNRNALLNITVVNYTNGLVTGFNYSIIDLNDSSILNGSTLTNTSSINIILGHSYDVTVYSSSLAITSNIVYINASFVQLNVIAYPVNSIKISSFLESTNTILSINASLLFFGSLSSFTRDYNGTNNTYFPLADDTYTITATSSGYATRSYVVTVSNGSAQFLNIYMLPVNSTSVIGIYTKDLSDNILPNAVIQIQQLVGDSYLGIAQGITDGNGFITFNLQEGKTYRLIISADNFNIFQITFVPYSANSPYTFKLSPVSSFVFKTLTDYVQYSYSPIEQTLNKTNNTFSLTTYSANGSVIYTSINCSNSIQNTSGSPTGTTVGANLNVSEGSTILCRYEFNIVEYGYYSFMVSYRRLSNEATTIKDSAEKIKQSTEQVWLTLLAFIIMLLVAMGVKQRFPDTRITGMIFCVGTIFFIAIGWINWVAGGVSATIGILLLYMGSR